jgi:hypothetical protein
MVAPSEPSAAIRRGKQGIDLLAIEKADQGPCPIFRQ